MIEVGLFDSGSSDFGHKASGDGVLVPDASWDDVVDYARRITLDNIRRMVLADRLGYDQYWQSEHHLVHEGAELSSNPIQQQTAAAVLTKRIRFGQMANILQFWHPVRLAEQLAILDIVSGGRLDVGVGRGYQPREVETFGFNLGGTVQDQERNRAVHEEVIDVLIKAWTNDLFSHHGQFFSIPPTYTKWHHPQTIAQMEDLGRDDVLEVGEPDFYSSGVGVMGSTTTLKKVAVLPRPIQQPVPPMWEPVFSERSVRFTAARGINSFLLLEPNHLVKKRIDIYMDEAEARGWPETNGESIGPFKHGWDAERRRGVGACRFMHISQGEVGNLKKYEKNMDMQWEYFGGFGFKAAVTPPGEAPDVNRPVDYTLMKELGLCLTGSTQEVLEGILKLRDECYPADASDFVINCYFEQVGLNEGETEEQMQVFAEEILPELRRACGGAVERPESKVSLAPLLDAPVASA